MRKRIILSIFKLINLLVVYSQDNTNVLGLAVRYNMIPIHIERTDLTRWMVFPSIDINYKLDSDISILGSYFYKDIRYNHLSYEEYFLYSETPFLTSYEEALEYIDILYGPSYFNNYVFLGIEKEFQLSKIALLTFSVQGGHRDGNTETIVAVYKQPDYPSGFHAISEVIFSNGFGLKLGSRQQIKIYKVFSLETSVGLYLFGKWPRVQYYFGGGLRVDIPLRRIIRSSKHS